MAKSMPTRLPCLGLYRARLLTIARYQLGPQSRLKIDPADIVHDTLLKAHRARSQFRGRTQQQLVGWLRAILATTIAGAVRTLRRQRDAERPLSAAVENACTRRPTPQTEAEQKEELLWLFRALARLPIDQREVLQLRHLEHRSLAEICEQTCRTKASVVGLLYRGMKKLRTTPDDAIPWWKA
jgi:RNA polymerase sigma-70 factor, ECF subfamily